MKGFSKVILVFTLLTFFVGCSTKEEVKTTEFEEDSYYISADTLNEQLKDENLVIIDARSADDYKKGHIDGAINVIWQQLSNVEVAPGEEGFGVLLEQGKLEKVLQDLGLNNDSKIVLYSNATEGWGEDGRILWSLLINGVEDVKLLDGGYEIWKDKDYAISKEAVVLDKGNITLGEFDTDLVIDTNELNGLIDDSEVKIIDTRDSSEFDGAVKYGEAKGGHIPNSINIPFTELYNDNNTIKSEAEVDAIMKENGISKDDQIITYCTAGIRSASMLVTLKTYGYENVRNYDESFYRWASVNEVE